MVSFKRSSDLHQPKGLEETWGWSSRCSDSSNQVKFNFGRPSTHERWHQRDRNVNSAMPRMSAARPYRFPYYFPMISLWCPQWFPIVSLLFPRFPFLVPFVLLMISLVSLLVPFNSLSFPFIFLVCPCYFPSISLLFTYYFLFISLLCPIISLCGY